jgi:protein subunit release factor B
LATLGGLLELADGDDALAAECRAGLETLAARIDGLRATAPGHFDDREAIVIVEPLGEAEGWSARLWRAYARRAEEAGRHVRLYHSHRDCRAVEMRIGGAGAFGWLAGERGVHRLHRGSGRANLGARVEVLAVAVSYDDIRVEDEVEADYWPEMGGCGGRLPFTSSSVSLRHVPTGTDAYCEGQGSTQRNRAEAWTLLLSRLLRLRRTASAEETAVFDHDGRSLSG